MAGLDLTAQASVTCSLTTGRTRRMYQRERVAMNLERSIERWNLCSPSAIAKGSEAQIIFYLRDAQHDIAALAAEVERQRTDIKEREQAFEIHWNATRTATKLWQEQHPGQEGTWPDHANLCVWLMGQLEAIREELSDFVDAYDDGSELHAAAMLRDHIRHAQKPRTQQETSFCSCSEEVHNCSGDAK